MTRHSYRERDYVFGQLMPKLPTSLGRTRAGLAPLLRVSRRAVGEWEGGLTSPKPEHLQHLIGLCVYEPPSLRQRGRKRRSTPCEKWLINGCSSPLLREHAGSISKNQSTGSDSK